MVELQPLKEHVRVEGPFLPEGHRQSHPVTHGRPSSRQAKGLPPSPPARVPEKQPHPFYLVPLPNNRVYRRVASAAAVGGGWPECHRTLLKATCRHWPGGANCPLFTPPTQIRILLQGVGPGGAGGAPGGFHRAMDHQQPPAAVF